jgi:hypothetical protein
VCIVCVNLPAKTVNENVASSSSSWLSCVFFSRERADNRNHFSTCVPDLTQCELTEECAPPVVVGEGRKFANERKKKSSYRTCNDVIRVPERERERESSRQEAPRAISLFNY